MSDFKAKMHQIRFPLGLRPDPAGEAYSAPPNLMAVFKGGLLLILEGGLKGRGTEGEVRERGKKEKGRRKEREGNGKGKGEGKGFAEPISNWFLRA